MVSPFYIEPAGAGLGQGLAGLGAIIGETRARKEEEKAVEAQRQRMADAQTALYDAMQTRDPMRMMEVATKYPEVSEMAKQGLGLVQDFQQREAADFAIQVLSDPQNAAAAAERRIQLLTAQGRDPKDTLEWYQNYQRNPQGAIQEMELMLPLIDPKVADAYQQSKRPMPDGTKVVGDYLVDAEGNVLFDASQGQSGGGEFGLTPMTFVNPETGEYQAFLPSKSGEIQAVQAPEGLQYVPDAGRMGYNPATIQTRGVAEAQTELETAPTRGRATRAEEVAATESQRRGAAEAKAAQFDLIDQVTDEALNQARFWTTGFLGSKLANVAGTPAADLAANLETLQAAAGFDKLQEMRNNSPNGGALGSVTERELALLQATWGSLQQSQSEEQFKRNLERFRRQVKESWERVSAAYERDYGQPYTGSPLAPSGMPVVPSASAPVATGGPVLRFNPATGEFE